MLGFSPLASAPLADDLAAVQSAEMTVYAVTAGNPSVDNLALTQAHDLSADAVTSGNPSVDQVAHTQEHDLSGDTVSSGAPSIESSSITQQDSLSTSDLATGPPTAASVPVTQVHTFTATDLSSSAPIVDSFSVAEAMDIGASGVTAQAPQVSNTPLQILTSAPAFNDVDDEYLVKYYIRDQYDNSEHHGSNNSHKSLDSHRTSLSYQNKRFDTTDVQLSSITEYDDRWVQYVTVVEETNPVFNTADQYLNIKLTLFKYDPDRTTEYNIFYAEVDYINSSSSRPSGRSNAVNVDTNKSNTGNRYPQLVGQTDGSGFNLRIYEGTSLQSTDTWWQVTSWSTSDPYSSWSVFDGRAALYLFTTNGFANSYNDHYIVLDAWNAGTHDEPATSTGFTAAPLAGTPIVDAAALDSTMALTANDVTATPVVDSASATIESDTEAETGDVVTGNPVVDNAAASVVYPFTTADVVSGAVDLDTANMAEDETFTTANVVAGAPTVPQPTYSEEVSLTATDTEAGTPVIDQPTYGENTSVVANAVIAGFFSVDTATMSEDETFGTSDIASGTPDVADTTASEYWSLEPQLNGGYEHDEYLRYYDPSYGVLQSVIVDDNQLTDTRIKQVKVGTVTEFDQYYNLPILFSIERNSGSNIGYFSSTLSLFKGGSIVNNTYVSATAPNSLGEDVDPPSNWSTYTAMGATSLQPYAKRNDGNRDGAYVTLTEKSGVTGQLEWTFADGTTLDAEMGIVDVIDNHDYMEVFDGRAVLYVVQENDTSSSDSTNNESVLVLAGFNVGWVDPPAAPTVIEESPLAGNPVVDTATMAEAEDFATSDITTGAFDVDSTPLQVIDPAPSMNAGKTGRDLLQYFTLQSDNQPIDYDGGVTSLDSGYYRYTLGTPKAGTVTTYNDRWEQDVYVTWYRVFNGETLYIRRKITVTVYKHGEGYSDENALTTSSTSFSGDLGYSSASIIDHVDSDMTLGDGRYYTSDFDTANIYNDDGTLDKSVNAWIFPGQTTGYIDSFAILNGRAVVHTYHRHSAGNTNNTHQEVAVELWSNGTYDPPATITEVIAAPLAGTPVVDQLAMITEHSLDADDCIGNAHEIATPIITQEEDLGADDVLSGTPFLDQAGLTENHSLVANDAVGGTPSIDQTGIDQDHSLTASDVAAGSPSSATSPITQDHSLAGDDTTSGTPAIDTCNMSEDETFNTSNLYSGAASVDSAAASIVYDLDADDCVSGNVFIGSLVLTEENDFVTEDVATAAPSVGSPTIAQVDALYAVAVTSGAPSVPTANMVEDETFNTSNLYTAPADVATADISQDEDIDAFSVTAQNVRIDSADATIIYDFDADAITTGDSFVQSTDLTETSGLSIADFDFGTPSVPTVSMAEDETFSVADVATGAPNVETINLIEAQDFEARDCVSQPVLIGSTEIDQDHRFIPSNVSSGTPSVDNTTITQDENLSGVDVVSGAITVPTPTITQDEALEATPTVADTPTVDDTTVGQDEFIEPLDVVSGTPFVRPAQVVALYEQTPRSVTSGAPVVDDLAMSEDETFSTSDITIGTPFVGNTEFLYSRKAGMTGSRNSVILADSKNIVALAYDGRNRMALASDGKNSVE